MHPAGQGARLCLRARLGQGLPTLSRALSFSLSSRCSPPPPLLPPAHNTASIPRPACPTMTLALLEPNASGACLAVADAERPPGPDQDHDRPATGGH